MVDRTLLTTRSFEYDAVIVAGPMPPADTSVKLLLGEMYRHCKAIAVLPGAAEVLAAPGVPSDAPGVVTVDSAEGAVRELQTLLRKHRVWERFPAMSEARLKVAAKV